MNIDKCSFQYNTATGSGGVFEIRSGLNYSTFKNSYYSSNKAGTNGGVFRLFNNSFGVVFMNNTFKQNQASTEIPNTYGGSDILVGSSINTLIENNTMIDSGYYSVRTAGSYFTSLNITVRNNFFYNCSYWFAFDTVMNSSITNNMFNNAGSNIGGSEITKSSNILVYNNSFQRSINGTMVMDINNYNISVIDCYFGYNKYNASGGAIYINSNNTIISIINTTFEKNSAMIGGAICSNASNSYLTLASCKFIGNSATENGGAVTLEQKHTSFALLDYTTYSNSLQLQTSHPYSSLSPVNGQSQKIYSQEVKMSAVSRYILAFDSRSSFWYEDAFYIYDSPNKTTILYSNIKDGADFPGVDSPSLIINSNQFYVEMIGPSATLILIGNYWGFLCNVYPIFTRDVMTTSHSSLFYQNSAASGGALYLSFLNTFSVILATDFIENKAVTIGGAINAYLTNYGLIFQQLRFINNSAGSSGGGIALSSSNYGCQITECLFVANTALHGSGIFLGGYNGQGVFQTSNEISIDASYFIQNAAAEGAGVAIDYKNAIIFSNVTFSNNTATSLGAAISVDTNNVVTVVSTVFNSNVVDSSGIGGGGGISSKTSNNITINNTTFTSNSGAAGGALLLEGGSELTVVGSNQFLRNAADTGGAIFGSSIPLWSTSDGSLTLVGNEAKIGSAIFIALFYDLNTVLTNITMIANTATISGTFFWVCTGSPTNLSSCQQPQYENLVFSNNSAPYGASFATQPVSSRTSNEYSVTVYNGPLTPSISLILYDFYGHEAVSDNLTTTTAAVIDSSCDGFVGTLKGGSTVEVARQGVVTLTDISANCNPNGSLTVQYTSQPSAEYFGGITRSEYNFMTTSVLDFRECYSGEKYLNGACVSCGNGTYSLTYSEDQSCQKCPPEAIDCYGSDINLAPGYWRISDTSDTILPCLYSGCKGGYGTINYHIQ